MFQRIEEELSIYSTGPVEKVALVLKPSPPHFWELSLEFRGGRKGPWISRSKFQVLPKIQEALGW